MKFLPKAARRRGEHKRLPKRPLRMGVIAVTAIIVVVAATVAVNSLQLGTVTYRADFAQAAGIEAGDSVTYAGVPIGSVSAIELAGDHVVVTMKLERDIRLGDDTRAAIKLTTMLGSRYIELRSNGVGEVPDKAIPISHTEVPYDLETVLQDATQTFGQVDADQIAQSMTTLSEQLDGLPPLVPEAVQNVHSLSAVIAQRREQIASLLTSTGDVTTAIREQQDDLAGLVGQGRTVLQEIMSRQDALRRMLDATTSLVHTLEPIAVGDREQLQTLLTDLHAMTGMIADNDALLRNILQILPVPWRLFANATGTGMELSANAPDGMFVDSFMCALSARAEELGRTPYREDCQ